MAEKKHWRDSMQERNQDWIKSRDKPKGGDWHGGKGYRSRVSNTDAYKENWDKIFGNKEEDSATSSTEKPTE